MRMRTTGEEGREGVEAEAIKDQAAGRGAAEGAVAMMTVMAMKTKMSKSTAIEGVEIKRVTGIEDERKGKKGEKKIVMQTQVLGKRKRSESGREGREKNGLNAQKEKMEAKNQGEGSEKKEGTVRIGRTEARRERSDTVYDAVKERKIKADDKEAITRRRMAWKRMKMVVRTRTRTKKKVRGS